MVMEYSLEVVGDIRLLELADWLNRLMEHFTVFIRELTSAKTARNLGRQTC